MSGLRYLRPARVSDALRDLSEWGHQARVLAGGTDLLVRMRQGTVKPEVIVDIGAIEELRGVRHSSGYVAVGALTTHGEIEQSPELAAWARVLCNASREVGSAQVRNRGTLGGNLANASPAGDTLPALYVLDAEVHLLRVGGERWVPIADFFTGPGKTACQADELLAEVRFRPTEPGEKSFFRKIGQRRAVRIAKASAAGVMLLDGDIVRRCRVALGALAPTVIRLPLLEEYLTGRQLTPETIDWAAAIAGEACQPITDIRSTTAYRRHVAAVLVERGIRGAIAEGED